MRKGDIVYILKFAPHFEMEPTVHANVPDAVAYAAGCIAQLDADTQASAAWFEADGAHWYGWADEGPCVCSITLDHLQ